MSGLLRKLPATGTSADCFVGRGERDYGAGSVLAQELEHIGFEFLGCRSPGPIEEAVALALIDDALRRMILGLEPFQAKAG